MFHRPSCQLLSLTPLLASINSDRENTFLKKMSDGNAAWIAGYRISGYYKSFGWYDGSEWNYTKGSYQE